MTQLASPYSTGGGGGDFENRVLAYYLGSALAGAVPRGLPDVVAREVSSQALYRGAPLDDILIRGDHADGTAQFAVQVKHTLVFGAADTVFVEVMRHAWETFTAASFHAGVDRFGIALGLYGKKIDKDYQIVLTWARHAASASDFLQRVSTPRLSSAGQRGFIELLQTVLREVSGVPVEPDAFWRFCRAFVLLHFDFQIDGSRDAALLQLVLQHGLDIDATAHAPQLGDALLGIAAEMRRTAGSHSVATLREQLGPRFSLRADRNIAPDLRRLRDHGAFILRNIGMSTRGVTLPREDVLAAVDHAMNTAGVVAIVGEPGSGKSGVLRELLEEQYAQGTVILLSGDRFSGSGFDTFLAAHSITSSPAELLHAIGTSETPCIFIDGIDRVTSADARRIVNDLLRLVAELNRGSARPWIIVVTARAQNLVDVQQWLALSDGQSFRSVDVELLSDVEFAAVSDGNPALQLLDTDERLRPMTRNLFMIAKLSDPRIVSQLPRRAALSEADISATWWQHVVSDGAAAGRARQTAVLQLAERIVTGNGAEPSDALSLHALEVDGIVARDAFGIARFTHDVLEDWTIARLLAQKGELLPTYLRGFPVPFRLFRALRLYACMLLEAGEAERARWRALLRAVEDDAALAAQWQQALLASPLLSVRADELLDDLAPILFADDGSDLRALCTAVLATDVTPNPRWASFFAANQQRSLEAAMLLMHEPMPRWQVWIPLIRWLVQRAASLPPPARLDVIRLFELWQVHAPEGSILRDGVADAALSWLRDRALSALPNDTAARYFERVRRIILLSADVRPDAVSEFVRQVANVQHHNACRQLLSESRSVATHVPRAYVDALLTIIIRDREPERDSLSDDYDFHDLPFFYPPAHAQGPFLPLLQRAEAQGLRFIHTLVNTAIDRWLEDQTLTPLPTSITVGTRTIEYWGGGRAYMWFRADGNGPPSVVSGLMALEFWMEQQVERGRDPGELFETVLSGSRCIAVPGLCLGIALAYPEQCLAVALALVSVPQLWSLDIARRGVDAHGSYSQALFGEYEVMMKLRADRDQQPQRDRDIRDLAMWYMLMGDDELRERFISAVSTFPDRLPFFFAEETDDAAHVRELREEVERYTACANFDNYVAERSGEQTFIRFEKPAHIAERDRPDQERLAETSTRLGLLLWADKTVRTGAADPSMSFEAAVRLAQRIGDASLLRTAIDDDGDLVKQYGTQALAATAAAVAIAAPEWLREHELVEWCLEVLRAASSATGSAIDNYTATARLIHHPRVYAAHGLSALEEAGLGEEGVHAPLLQLALDRMFDVQIAVSVNLRRLWPTNRALAWELLALAVTANQQTPYRRFRDERDLDRDAGLVAAHTRALAGQTPSPLARIQPDDKDFFWYGFMRGMAGVPFDLVTADSEAMAQVTQLIEDLTEWTIARDRAAKERDRHSTGLDDWTSFLGAWLARLSSYLVEPDAYERIVASRIRDAWAEPLDLVADFLDAYISIQFGTDKPIPALQIERWSQMAIWLLGTAHVAAFAAGRRVSREAEDAISLLVLTRHGSPRFKTAWPNASAFAAVISAWVDAVAPAPTGFMKVLYLLDDFAPEFCPQDVLMWLTQFTINGDGRSIDTVRLQGDAGARVGRVLHAVWMRHGADIRASVALRTMFSALLDALRAVGVPLTDVLVTALRA